MESLGEGQGLLLCMPRLISADKNGQHVFCCACECTQGVVLARQVPGHVLWHFAYALHAARWRPGSTRHCACPEGPGIGTECAIRAVRAWTCVWASVHLDTYPMGVLLCVAGQGRCAGSLGMCVLRDYAGMRVWPRVQVRENIPFCRLRKEIPLLRSSSKSNFR